MVSDFTLQTLGVAAFLIPLYLVLYSVRWFRSRPINSPYAKTLGCVALLVFIAGLLGLPPWELSLDGSGTGGRFAGPHRR